jgi:hypothetical protein
VVWAHVPFEDVDGEKTRPAVVVRRQGRQVELLPGTTSHTRWVHVGRYVEIEDLAEAGLTRSTGVRRSSVVVDLIEVIEIVGALSDDDALEILVSGTEPAVERLQVLRTAASPGLAVA